MFEIMFSYYCFSGNLVPRVSHLTTPWGERGELSSLASCGKMRDPGNEVVLAVLRDRLELCFGLSNPAL